MGELNLVPKTPLNFDDMSALADQHGWKLDRKELKKAQRYDSGQSVWRTDEGRVVLHNDATVHQDYLVIEAGEGTRLEDLLRSTRSFYDDGEISGKLAAADSSQEVIEALHLVAARAFPVFDSAIFESVTRHLKAPDELTRLAAALAAYRLGWRQFRPALEEAKTSDQSDLVQTMAANYLDLRHWDRG